MVTDDEDIARLKVTNTTVDHLVATANGRDQCFNELCDRINGLLEQLRGSMLGSGSISEDFAAETEQPMQLAMAPSRSLFVFIENQTRTLSEDELLPFFAIHGGLERIILLRKNPNLQALILYDDITSAISAMDSLDGKYIYDGSCELCIEFSDKFVAPRNLVKESVQRTGVQGMCLMKYGGEYFEPMPIVLASVHNQLYPITVEVLHQVFDAHGEVKEIEIVDEFPTLQVRVKYHSSESAMAARNALDGVNIYAGCCQLEVELVCQKLVKDPSHFKQNLADNLQEELVDVKGEVDYKVQLGEEPMENSLEVTTGDFRPSHSSLEQLNLQHDAVHLSTGNEVQIDVTTLRSQAVNTDEDLKVSPEITFTFPSSKTFDTALPSTCSLRCQNEFNDHEAKKTWYVTEIDGKCGVEQHSTTGSNNRIIDTKIVLEMSSNLDIEPWPNWNNLRALVTGDIKCSMKGIGEVDVLSFEQLVVRFFQVHDYVRFKNHPSSHILGFLLGHIFVHSLEGSFRNYKPEMVVSKEVGYPPPFGRTINLLEYYWRKRGRCGIAMNTKNDQLFLMAVVGDCGLLQLHPISSSYYPAKLTKYAALGVKTVAQNTQCFREMLVVVNSTVLSGNFPAPSIEMLMMWWNGELGKLLFFSQGASKELLQWVQCYPKPYPTTYDERFPVVLHNKVVRAVNCARRGWVNVDVDTISCEACEARIFFSIPSSWAHHQVDKVALVFSLKLDNGHKQLCPWIANACDEELAQFQPRSAEFLHDEYKERLSALSNLAALPVISASSIEYMSSPHLEHLLSLDDGFSNISAESFVPIFCVRCCSLLSSIFMIFEGKDFF